MANSCRLLGGRCRVLLAGGGPRCSRSLLPRNRFYSSRPEVVLDSKRKKAVLGGGEKRIEGQHKKVCFWCMHCNSMHTVFPDE